MNLKWVCCTLNELSTVQLYEYLRLRAAVFVVEQHCPYQDLDRKDFGSFHLVAFDENETALACLRVVEPGVSYSELSIGRVATLPAARGKGLGREAMKRGLEFVRDRFGELPVRISAQSYLEKFYRSFGFETVSEPYLEDDIPHIEMIKTQWNYE